MGNLGNWILGAAASIMAVGALFVSARAGEGVPYYGGLLFFLFAIGFVFYLIKVTCDEQEH